MPARYCSKSEKCGTTRLTASTVLPRTRTWGCSLALPRRSRISLAPKTLDLYPSRLGVAVATTRPQPQPQPQSHALTLTRHDERFEGAAGRTAFAHNSHHPELCHAPGSPSLKKKVDSQAGDGAAGVCSAVIATRAMNKGGKKATADEGAAGRYSRPPSPPLTQEDLAHRSVGEVQPKTQGRSYRPSHGRSPAPWDSTNADSTPADLDAVYLSALAQGREMLDGGGCAAPEPPRRVPFRGFSPL